MRSAETVGMYQNVAEATTACRIWDIIQIARSVARLIIDSRWHVLITEREAGADDLNRSSGSKRLSTHGLE